MSFIHDLDDRTRAQVHAFAVLFLRWNQRINLSAARTRDELDEHIEDCSHVIPFLAGRSHVLDVGSGGGLPVVIAAIALPDTHFTALEPVHKKHAFLRTAARELSLPNLDALAQRLDDHVSTADLHKGAYDAAMSRATFDLASWLTLGLVRVHDSGIVLGFEGADQIPLPPFGARHPYQLANKTRAIISVHRPSRGPASS